MQKFNLIQDVIVKQSDIDLSVTSEYLIAVGSKGVAIQATWANVTGTGQTFDVLISNDGEGFESILPAPEALAGSGTKMIVEQVTPYQYIKIVFTAGADTVGTGKLQIQ